MRKMKKLLSILVAATMTLAMAAPSFAEPGDGTDPGQETTDPVQLQTPDTTINIGKEEDDDSAQSTSFAAYKLLNATNGAGAVDPETGKPTELYAYTVNEKYESILLSNLPDGQTDIIAFLGTLENDSDALNKYADAVYRAIQEAQKADPEFGPDAETATGSFASVPQGYYLIVDNTDLSGTTGAVHSTVLLDTAGRNVVNITTKKDVPKGGKQIIEGEGEDREALDSADSAIGKPITYELTGTLPTDYARYETYSYKFTDTLPASLDFVGNIEYRVRNAAGEERELDGVTVTAPVPTNRVFVVTFDDLMKDESIIATDTIVVRYTAQLNSQAIIGGAGNRNEVEIEYPNNPYDSDSKGTTTTETVDVFSYGVTVNKTDAAGTALRGAGFTLYSTEDGGTTWTEVDTISSVENGVVSEQTTFKFTGLDAGTYKIEETTIPDGYNKAGDIIFTLVATTEKNTADKTSKVTSLTVTDVTVGGVASTAPIFTGTFTADQTPNTTGVVSTTVVNNSGTELPSTGGIGTTIFYAAGIILMAGAVFFVVRRRRA